MNITDFRVEIMNEDKSRVYLRSFFTIWVYGVFQTTAWNMIIHTCVTQQVFGILCSISFWLDSIKK